MYFEAVISILMTQFGELMTSSLSEICQILRTILAPLCSVKWWWFGCHCDGFGLVIFEPRRMRIVFWTQFRKAEYLPHWLIFNWICAICCDLLKAESTSYRWVSCCPPTLPPMHLILSFPSACIIIPLQLLGKEAIGFKCSWLTNLYLNTQLGTLSSQQSSGCCMYYWWFPECPSERFPSHHATIFAWPCIGKFIRACCC